MKTQIFIYPPKSEWNTLLQRPTFKAEDLQQLVASVFDKVEKEGDKALLEYTQTFDKVSLQRLQVTEEEFTKAEENISEELKNAIQLASANIRKFHEAQQETKKVIHTQKGVECWRESRPIEKVGIYIPGGLAPLFSTVLMLAIPAQIAGCREIVLCSPPDQKGKLNDAILYAAKISGVTSAYKVGGIQAVAGLSLGTETIPKVYKIFGPGNQYVTAAKQYAQQLGIAIDMPAGPSEVLVIADKNAYADFVAADLLSQAEHGADSQVIFLTDDEDMLTKVVEETQRQLAVLPRKEFAEKSISNSRFIVLKNLEDCMDFSNTYAPEHLIIATENADELGQKVINAGAVFLGKFSCESAGDYASGTNHTLPTNGFARAYSGVSLDSFIKKITFQKIDEQGVQHIGNAIVTMANAEGLTAHARAMELRLENLLKYRK